MYTKIIALSGKKDGMVKFENTEIGIKIEITIDNSQDMLMRAFLVADKTQTLYKIGVLDASYNKAYITKTLNISIEDADNIDAAFIIMYERSFPKEVISIGFVNEEFDLYNYFYKADINTKKLPDFISVFKRNYGVVFNSYTYKDIDMKLDILNYVFSANSCRKSVFENGGFYYALIESKAIIGVIGEKQQEIFSDILPNSSFLSFYNETTKGAFFVGVDFIENKIFSLIFKNKA